MLSSNAAPKLISSVGVASKILPSLKTTPHKINVRTKRRATATTINKWNPTFQSQIHRPIKIPIAIAHVLILSNPKSATPSSLAARPPEIIITAVQPMS